MTNTSEPIGELEEQPPEEIIDYQHLLVQMRGIGVGLKQLCGLPPGELALLITLDKWMSDERSIRPSDLGKEMHLSRPAISRMLKSLKEKGFLELSSQTQDHRYVKVALTEEGRASLKEELRKCSDVLKRVVSRMGIEDLHRMLSYNEMFVGYLMEELKQRTFQIKD